MPTNRFDRSTATNDQRQADDSSTHEADTSATGPAAFRHLQTQFALLVDYARLYAEAKKDGLVVSVRKWIVLALVGLAVFALTCTLLVTAAVLSLVGLAQGLSHLLEAPPWAGNLIAGLGFLLLVASSVGLGVWIMERKFRQQTVNKYVEQRQSQRSHRAASHGAGHSPPTDNDSATSTHRTEAERN